MDDAAKQSFCPGPGQQTAALQLAFHEPALEGDKALHGDAAAADLELDQALAHAMRSPVDIAKSSSEAPHADLDLAAHVGVAAQGGEEVLGWRGDLVGLHEPHIVGHC